MNFDIEDSHKALQEKIKDLFSPDYKAALDSLENRDNDQIRETTLNCLNRLGHAGYLTLGLEDGKDNVGLLAAQEALANISTSLFLTVEVSTRIFGQFIAVYGTSEQKAQILPNLKHGQCIGAVALSEGGMSIENNSFTTTGTPVDGGFRVSGSMDHVVNAPIADWIAVAGKVSGKGEKGVAFFLINKESEGLSIGQRHTTLGYNGAAISPISLQNCFVPSKWTIGPFEDEVSLKTVRTWEDEILTAASLGLMQRSFDVASSHSKGHVSGGKPIIAYQEVAFKLAEMLTLFQTAQLLAYRAVWMTQTGDREAAILAHTAKVFCTESAEEVASNALQILGGYGYLHGNPAEESYRNAKYLQIAGTSSEISRMKIGDGVLERD
jgi:alkylation response protein AidB-like acyl-CoA dehydrogenase